MNAVNPMPGGGEYGRSAKREVRNPVLALPSAKKILDLPVEVRRPLGILLRELAEDALAHSARSWKSNKAIMAAYWKAVSVYAKHIARVIDPISARAAAATGWDTKICLGCGHVGERPPAPALSCCPEREAVSIRDLVSTYERDRRVEKVAL